MIRACGMSGMMRALLLAALSALPAQAQDAEAALAAVQGCLAGASDTDGERACIGSYAQTCIAETPGGETTVGISDCVIAETAAWDRVLNETFADLMVLSRERMALEEQSGTPPAALDDMLRDAQRAWIAFRDADCAQAYAVWGEGSMRQIAGAYCGLERTAQRVFELRAKRADLEPV